MKITPRKCVMCSKVFNPISKKHVCCSKKFILEQETEGKTDNPEVFHTLRKAIDDAEGKLIP